MIEQSESSRLMEKRYRYAQLLRKMQSDEARDDILYIIRVINDRINADINRRLREM